MSTIAYSSPAYSSQAYSSPAYSSQVTRPRLKLTPRGRGVLAVLIAIPLSAAALVIGVGAPGATATDTAITDSFTYVTIEPGQSLWQVAEQVAPQADPRAVIDDLLALNQLRSADVQPGQELAIPAEYAG